MDDITKEKACLCALNRVFGFAPKIGIALLSHLGSAEEVFSLDGKDLDYLLGPYSRYRNDIGAQNIDSAAEELVRLERSGIRFTGWNERGYPSLLKECPDAPLGLYIRSDTPDEELWSGRRSVAAVGTRDISPYGREWCGNIVRGLSRCSEKPVIVSGLAIGTDICAHRTAVDSGLPTIAVMATGPDTVYPVRHTDFADILQHTPGCALVTDYPPGTAPLAVHFLRRNRIIAGLSESTILIESKTKGGGMMTANLAFSYGRGVYAVPGRIDDIRSQGCNLLIRQKVAEAVTDIDSLADALGLKRTRKEREKTEKERIHEVYGSTMPSDKVECLTRILLKIRQERGITVEDIALGCGLTYEKTVRMTGLLESDGLISIDLLQRCRINSK